MVYRRATQDEIGSRAFADLAAWLFFQISAGHILLPVLAATFVFSKTASRSPLVVNVCLTWIISAIVSSLLFYAGKHVGSDPSRRLCVAQASLMDAVPMMTTAALLSLAFHVWHTFDSGRCQEVPRTRKRVLVVLLAVPYVMFGMFFGIAYKVANIHSDDVDREHQYFYCSLHWKPLNIAIGVLSTIVCIVALSFLAHFGYNLVKNRRALRRRSNTATVDTDLFARTLAFALYLSTATVLRLASIWSLRNALPDMFYASVGMALLLIFVSSRNVFHAWCFWRRYHSTIPAKLQSSLHRNGSVDLPTLGFNGTSTVSDTASAKTQKDTSSREYYESKVNGRGVEIIGKPEEAFTRDQLKMSTVTTLELSQEGV